MTKRDYQAIADGLFRSRPSLGQHVSTYDAALATWNDCTVAIGRVLAGDNPRFDARTFYAACEHGLQSDAYRAALRAMRKDRRAA